MKTILKAFHSLAMVLWLFLPGIGHAADDEIPEPPADPAAVQAKAQYRYQVPKKLQDGWEVGDFRKEKADLKKIALGVDKIQTGTIPGVRSLLILKDGKLLLEEYFNGQTVEKTNPMFSCTKSVFSTVYGIAQDQGFLSLDQKIYSLYPDFRSGAGWDKRKDGITVGMLLSMTSGLGCDDVGKPPCWEPTERSPDWLAFALRLPMANPPGEKWTYNGSCLTLLTNLIAKKSGMDFSDFADKNLLAPLGIEDKLWEKGPNGVVKAGSGLAWKSRDMAKLGQLYLDKGMWKGKRIVSESWVKEATTNHVVSGTAFGHDYGYLWHIKDMWWKGGWVPIFYANGYLGQAIFVSPQAGLVCVMTAASSNESIYMMEESFFANTVLEAFK